MAGYGKREDTRAFQVKPSAPVTAFPFNSDTQYSRQYSTFALDIDVTALAGGTNLSFVVQYLDPATNAYLDLLTGPAIATAGFAPTHQRLHVSPRIPAAANAVAQTVAPKQWRVRAVQTGGVTSATFSLGVTYGE